MRSAPDEPVIASYRQPALCPSPGSETVPIFDRGWLRSDGGRDPYLDFAEQGDTVNWSTELEALHVESSRDHFLDVWTRRAMLSRLGPLAPGAVIVDLGCSTGYLLEDLQAFRPDAHLIGVDLVESGLRNAHGVVPDACLLRADVCALPLHDASVDAVVSANLLEHVSDDEQALAEIFRIMRPGARATIVVPAGPGNYDYYDRFLGHQRRYGRAELARKANGVGLEVLEDIHLGAPLYPAFWVVKQRNRLRYDHLRGKELERKVAKDIERTRNSPLGHLACRLEEALLHCAVRLPFGIRGLTVLVSPRGGS